MSLRESCGCLAVGMPRHLADQLPVLVILRLRLDDALRRDELRGSRAPILQGELHGLDETLALEPNDRATRCLAFRIEPDAREHRSKNLLVVRGLCKVLFPLGLKLRMLRASDGRLVPFWPPISVSSAW